MNRCQVQAEIKACRVQQPQQRRKGRLPLVTLVHRDHDAAYA